MSHRDYQYEREDKKSSKIALHKKANSLWFGEGGYDQLAGAKKENDDEHGDEKEALTDPLMSEMLAGGNGSEKENGDNKGVDKQKLEKARELVGRSQQKYVDEIFSSEGKPFLVFRIKKRLALKYWDELAIILKEQKIEKTEPGGTTRLYRKDEMAEVGRFTDQGYFEVFSRPSQKPQEQVQQSTQNTTTAPAGDQKTSDSGSDGKNTGQQGDSSQDKKPELEVVTVRTATSPEAAADSEPEIKTRYSGTPRSDVSWKKALSKEQEEKYRWSECYKMTKEANPGWGTETVAQFTRRLLQDGWDIDSDGPQKLDTVYADEYDEKGRHIIEAGTYNQAVRYAKQKKKEGDYSYDTFIWRKKISHHTEFQGTAESSATAYRNFEENKGQQVDFATLAQFAGPEAKQYLAKINTRKAYNDKLLSEDFVSLVYLVQQKLYPDESEKANRNGVWDEGSKVKFASYAEDQKDRESKIAAEQKALVDELAAGKPDRNGYWVYVRDGRNLRVHKATLEKLQSIIKSNPRDADDFFEEWTPSNPKEKDDLAYMLTGEERTAFMFAYAKEVDVDDSEQKVLNAILKNTPPSQRAFVGAMMKWYESKYGMKSWFSEGESLAEYQENRETILGEVDIRSVNEAIDNIDVNDDGEDAAEDLTEEFASLSPGQVKALSWYKRRQLLEIFAQESPSSDDEDWKYFPKLLNNTPESHTDIVRNYLSEGNFMRLINLRENTPAGQLAQVEPLLEAWYDNDPTSLKTIQTAAAIHAANITPENYRSLERMLYALPLSVFRKLTDEQRLSLYQIVIYRSRDIKYNGAILKKILSTVATGVDKKKQESAKQGFYNGVNKTLDKNLISLNFKIKEEEEREEVLRLLYGMDKQGSAKRIADTIKESRDSNGRIKGNADDLAAKMPDEDMGRLSVNERVQMLNNIVGESWTEYLASFSTIPVINPKSILDIQNLTVNLERDEQTVLRLLYTTPDEHMEGLMKALGQGSGDLYERIQSAVDGSNFQALHDNFKKKGNEHIDKMTPEEQAKEKQRLQNMQDKGHTDPNALKWDDYSILGLVVFDSGYEYDVSWTKDGLIQIDYESKDWKDVYLPLEFRPLASTLKHKPQKRAPLKPMDWIAVHAMDDDPELGLVKGEVTVIPAINLFRFESKQTMGHVWEAVDIISLVLSLGELSAAVGMLKWLLAATDVVLTAGSMITRTFGNKLPKSWVEGWQEISGVVSTFQIFYMAGTGLNALRKKIGNMREQAKLLANLTKEEREAIDKVMDAYEKMINNCDEMSQAADKATLQKTLDDLDANKSRFPEPVYNKIRGSLKNKMSLADEKAAFMKSLDDKIPQSTQPVIPAGEKVQQTTSKWTAQQKRTMIKGTDQWTEEIVEITRDSKKMTFKRKPGQAWKIADEGAEADDLAKQLEKDLNKGQGDEGLKEVMNKVDEAGAMDSAYQPYGSAKLQKLISSFEKQGITIVVGEGAEQMLKQHKASALYVPGEAGKPGVIFLKSNPKHIEVVEELVHVGQHRKLKWKKLTREELLDLEIDAQKKLKEMGERKGWSKEEIEQFEEAMADWEREKKVLQEGIEKGDESVVFKSKDISKVTPTAEQIADLIKTRREVETVLEPYVEEIKELVPGASVGYRGSLVTGIRYKKKLPFNPEDFDFDGFIVSDRLAREIDRIPGANPNWRDAILVPELEPIIDELNTALRKKFPKNTNKKNSTFRVYTTKEYYSIKAASESKLL
jgi:hypothetical protein